jgi:hypothetical protein
MTWDRRMIVLIRMGSIRLPRLGSFRCVTCYGMEVDGDRRNHNGCSGEEEGVISMRQTEAIEAPSRKHDHHENIRQHMRTSQFFLHGCRQQQRTTGISFRFDITTPHLLS